MVTASRAASRKELNPSDQKALFFSKRKMGLHLHEKPDIDEVEALLHRGKRLI